MKKLLRFFLAVFCFLSMTASACAAQLQLEGDVLPDYMRIVGCLCGDVDHNYLALAGYLGTHKYAQDVSWQKEFWPHQRISGLETVTVNAGGDATYVITPKYKGTTILIAKLTTGAPAEQLAKVKNKTVILYCRAIAAHPDTVIVLQYKGKTVKFVPQLSAADKPQLFPASFQDCSDWLQEHKAG